MKRLILPIFLAASASFSFGQTTLEAPVPLERRPGEIMVQLTDNVDLPVVLSALNEAGRGTVAFQKNLAPDWQIWLFSFDENQVPATDFLAAARQTPGVRFAQWNHRAAERNTEPNDPEWWRQDDMDLIGAPSAWDASTGGVMYSRDSIKGDTIVVAVLEKGTLLSHPDLAPNRWHNWAETPGNDTDDDNNGYVDDFGGWDARNDGDGTAGNNNHGTAVSGIIGARGNNGIGVTGVNWTVKLMNISNVEFEAEIIAAYYYAGKARRLYNQTNGQKGSFVVATNASFGLDKEKASEHPLWCAVYDSLGKVGILGVGATTNQNTNVDAEGDMPTSCTSEFLIAVNNVDKFGNKAASTGFGANSIDLGAPGQDTYTTANLGINNPSYGTFGGTSSATPHVTGAVALLYSVPCDALTSDALVNPADCARRVRDILLDSVEPETSLQGKTTTGGYLNIAKSVNGVRTLCDGVVGPLHILEVKTASAQNFYEVYYQTPTFDKYQFRVFNMLGQLIFEKQLTPQQFGINRVEYDASKLPAGAYVMSIGRGKIVASRKFQKN